jgi:hypothetical protein
VLNELIREIGYDNIIKTVMESVDMTNSLYIKIPLDRGLQNSDFLYIGKELEVSQFEKATWFKSREFYSNYIESNKAISIGGVYSKLIFSSHKYAVFFKLDNFINHQYTIKNKNLLESMDLLFKKYFVKLELEDFYEKYYKQNLSSIIDFFTERQLEKINIKIFLDEDLVKYEKDYSLYLKNRLFDAGTVMKVEKEIKGRLSKFITLNVSKPYLSQMMEHTDEIHLLNEDECMKAFYLKEYMDIKKDELVNNIKYKMDFQSSSKKWVLSEYENNPYETKLEMKNVLYVSNVMDNQYFKEVYISNYNELSEYINKLLDNKIKKYYSEMDKTPSKFKTFAIMYYKMISNIKDSNFYVFKQIYKSMSKNIFLLYKDEESLFKIADLINFDVSMRDYLFKTNIKEDFKNMIETIKEKILKGGAYKIESDKEFFILSGQLAKYLKLKTQTSEKTNKLLYEYIMAKKVKRLIQVLIRDKGRLDYDGHIVNRAGNVFAAINEYYDNNKNRLIEIDLVQFNMGMYYNDSVFYVKNESNNNMKDEVK